MTAIRKLTEKAKNFFNDLFQLYRYSQGHVHLKQESDQILIYVDGHMGDILMDANAIHRLFDYFTHTGKRVYLLGSEETKTTLGLVASLQNIVFVSVPKEDIEAENIRSVEHFLRTEYFDKIIIVTQWEHPFILNLVSCADCNESWEVVSKRKSGRINRMLFFTGMLHRDFTNRIIVDRETPQVERTKLLLTSLGITNFRTSIANIRKTCDYSVPGPYMTVSVDSNDSKRRWQTEKFVQLIQQLLHHCDEDIYLTGMPMDKSEMDKYVTAFQNEDRIKIKIGQLRLIEWVELIRGSKLHIGVDSGSIHVAASVGTKSICLTGVWDGRRIFPYQRDCHSDGTETPVCVVRTDVNTNSLTCYGCLGIKHIGYGNKKCLIECQNQRPCLCLQAIEVDDVWNAVNNVMEYE